MRTSALVAWLAAQGVGVVVGQDAAVEAPVFLETPSVDRFFFAETFQGSDPFAGRWAKSSNAKYAGQPVSVGAEDDAPEFLSKDQSLLLDAANQHYGVAGAFPSPLVVRDSDFVVQYEVKLTEGLTCGGAYIKLLQAEAGLDVATFDNESPYVIMFGPDSCGDTNKVHFILRHQNPVSKEWEEKHAQEVPAPKRDTQTHLYTLVIRADNSYEILIDLDSKATGSLLEDLSPAVNPSKTIDDPTDSKPADWVDEAMIPDPEASKPEDWDEDAPRTIPDADATMPSDWLEAEAAFIPDPSADEPSDWDAEEDGEWEAPLVANPKCAKASGCGPWERPTIPNPEYKGKWSAPMIDNPEYKGQWSPRQIDNPNYFEDAHPHNLAAIGAVAVEIWTTNGGIRMDNFVVDTDVDAVKAFGAATFLPKQTAEDANDAEKAKEQERIAREEKRMQGGIANLIEVGVLDLIDMATENPVPAVGTVLAVLISLIFFCSSGGKKPERTRAEPPASAAEPAAAAAEEDEQDAPAPKEKTKKKKTPRAS